DHAWMIVFSLDQRDLQIILIIAANYRFATYLPETFTGLISTTPVHERGVSCVCRLPCLRACCCCGLARHMPSERRNEPIAMQRTSGRRSCASTIALC